ncbi:hypothetical protein F9U64_06285 [Gracilibacillus oryzae]|uniref:Lipoprotein n=1 Tax=Gracilibacillus oryzae TaxID=1672701 RepID=A0A7C8KVB4_9BACI|nr:hypothetical protein [Gracilibacillus oryzae]KAB8138147.1 hypothetical protein F9U64_06285 [Gracilibacillus oryzae]
MNSKWKSILVFLAFLTVLGCSDREPPGLTISVGKETVRATLGSYNWSYDQPLNGTRAEIDAHSAVPPELVSGDNTMEVTANAEVELDFEKEPISYTVRIWDDDHNIISKSDNVVLSGEGKVVYEVSAEWEQGTASYTFALNIQK